MDRYVIISLDNTGKIDIGLSLFTSHVEFVKSGIIQANFQASLKVFVLC